MTLMAERNVTRAARRVGLSQPALSNALERLRRDFGDDLFVRSGKGMTPTPRALALEGDIADVLSRARTLYDDGAFVAEALDGHFRIATTDYLEHVLLPGLLPFLGRHAPKLTTIIRPTDGSFPKEALESGALDLAVAGFFGALPEGFFQRTLLEETYACVVRRDHPQVRDRLTLETYLRLEHILVSPQGDLVGAVDQVLASRGLKRRIVAGVSNFHSPAAIIAASDYVITVPSRLAEAYARVHAVACFPPPIDVPGFKLVQVWHGRTHTSPAHVWLRKAIETVLKERQDSAASAGSPDGSQP